MSPPSHLPPHPTPQLVTESQFEFPESSSKFPLTICFTRGIVNFYVTLSVYLPFFLLSPHLSTGLFLHYHPENKLISAISSNSIYMCQQYTMYIFLFLAYFTLYNRLKFRPPH